MLTEHPQRRTARCRTSSGAGCATGWYTGRVVESSPLFAQFSEILRRQMQQRGVSQRQLAQQAQISPNTLAAYLTGTVEPSPRVLARLAGPLGVVPETLFAAVVHSGPEGRQSSGDPSWRELVGYLPTLLDQFDRAITSAGALKDLTPASLLADNLLQQDKDGQWRVEFVPHWRGAKGSPLRALYSVRVRFRRVHPNRLDPGQHEQYWQDLDTLLMNLRRELGGTWEEVHELDERDKGSGPEDFVQLNLQVWQAPREATERLAVQLPFRTIVGLGAPAGGVAAILAGVAQGLGYAFSSAASEALRRYGVDPLDDGRHHGYAYQTEVLRRALARHPSDARRLVMAGDEHLAMLGAADLVAAAPEDTLVVHTSIPQNLVEEDAENRIRDARRRGTPGPKSKEELVHQAAAVRAAVEERQKAGLPVAYLKQAESRRALSDQDQPQEPNNRRFEERLKLAAGLLLQLHAAYSTPDPRLGPDPVREAIQHVGDVEGAVELHEARRRSRL